MSKIYFLSSAIIICLFCGCNKSEETTSDIAVTESNSPLKEIQKEREKLDKTVFENVSFAQEVIGMDRKTIRFKTWEVLKNVGLTPKKDIYPAYLSGGEQQRIAIARAMVNEPSIILADEPTGNLDPDISIEILKLFEELNKKGTTIIFATHSQEIIKLGEHRIINLRQGKAVEF